MGAAVIEKRIEKVKTEEKNHRNDLYVLANSYSGRLKTIKASLMPETDFHNVPKKTNKAATTNGTVAHSKDTKDSKDSKEAVETKGSPTKGEAMEVTNGEVDVKEEKKANGKVTKEKKETKKKDEVKKENDVAEKSRKRPKETKKSKDDDDNEEDGADDEQRESSVASNASADSKKADALQDGEEATRSKRRKTESKVSI